MSLQNTDQIITISDLGQLSPQTWSGKISVPQMLADGIVTQAAIDKAVQDIADYYVDVDPGAPTRCIDGRSNPIADDDKIGPQVPAGTPGAALAYHLAAVDDVAENYLLDAEAIVAKLRAGGITPGGHRDEHNAHTDHVGCGAIDGMDRALATMLNPEMAAEHLRLTQAIMGEDFDKIMYDQIMKDAQELLGPDSTFFAGREAIIDEIEAEYPDSVGVLVGDHHECIVALNTIPDTTFATDRFVETHEGVQAFGYDVWRTPVVARILFPDDAQTHVRLQFIMSRVMVAVATLMILTDGTQRLLVRAEQ